MIQKEYDTFIADYFPLNNDNGKILFKSVTLNNDKPIKNDIRGKTVSNDVDSNKNDKLEFFYTSRYGFVRKTITFEELTKNLQGYNISNDLQSYIVKARQAQALAQAKAQAQDQTQAKAEAEAFNKEQAQALAQAKAQAQAQAQGSAPGTSSSSDSETSILRDPESRGLLGSASGTSSSSDSEPSVLRASASLGLLGSASGTSSPRDSASLDAPERFKEQIPPGISPHTQILNQKRGRYDTIKNRYPGAK